MKRNKKIKNFFGRYEAYLYASIAALIYGAIDWWYGFSPIWYITGTLGIVVGIVGIILFDCLRVKTDEFDRYVRERLDRARGAGLFEPEDTFLVYMVDGTSFKKVANDGKLRTELCYETRLRVDRDTIRMETYSLHVLTEETQCFTADFPVLGASAKEETVEVNDGKRTWRQSYVTISAADGRVHRFPVPVNNADVDQLIDRIKRHNHA